MQMAKTGNNPVKRGEVYWVNLDPTVGSEIKKTRPAIKFIKGLKLGNTYKYSNGDYFAELTYNIRQNKEVYTLRIPERYVKVKESSEWYYLDLLEGWILSDFCEIN